jgi:hypothetical protein
MRMLREPKSLSSLEAVYAFVYKWIGQEGVIPSILGSNILYSIQRVRAGREARRCGSGLCRLVKKWNTTDAGVRVAELDQSLGELSRRDAHF